MSMKCKVGLHCELCDSDCEHYQEMIPLKRCYAIHRDMKRFCSNCQKDITVVSQWSVLDYCPYCGAKMEGVLYI